MARTSGVNGRMPELGPRRRGSNALVRAPSRNCFNQRNSVVRPTPRAAMAARICLARRPFGQFREDLGPTLRGLPSPADRRFRHPWTTLPYRCNLVPQITNKHDASPPNCESIRKLCNRKVVGIQCPGVPINCDPPTKPAERRFSRSLGLGFLDSGPWIAGPPNPRSLDFGRREGVGCVRPNLLVSDGPAAGALIERAVHERSERSLPRGGRVGARILHSSLAKWSRRASGTPRGRARPSQTRAVRPRRRGPNGRETGAVFARPFRQLVERERRGTQAPRGTAEIEELRDAEERHHPPPQGGRRQGFAPVLGRSGPWRTGNVGGDARYIGGSASTSRARRRPEQTRGPQRGARRRGKAVHGLREDGRQHPEKSLNFARDDVPQRQGLARRFGTECRPGGRRRGSGTGIPEGSDNARSFPKKSTVSVTKAALDQRPGPANVMLSAGLGVFVEAGRTTGRRIAPAALPLPPDVQAFWSAPRRERHMGSSWNLPKSYAKDSPQPICRA